MSDQQLPATSGEPGRDGHGGQGGQGGKTGHELANARARAPAKISPTDPLAGLLELQAIESAEFPETNYGRSIRWGVFILLIGLGGFLLWATLAPLDQGVPAPGVVAVESVRKRIDHLAGGVIDKILVREGQEVKEGDDLIALNEVQAKAGYNAAFSQWAITQASMARLTAERDGLANIEFSAELRQAGAGNADVAKVLRDQEGLFRSRRNALQGELRIIRESVSGLEKQLATLESVRTGRDKQIALFREQLDSYEKLRSQGYVTRSYLLDIERQLAEVQTRQGEDLSNVASINAKLSEFRMHGAQREVEYRREVETQLAEVQKDAGTLVERVAASRDTVNRLVIKAPVSGVVVDLAFHTIGGVIKPGDRILDIVPKGDQLIIDAQVAPQYIDRLKIGLPADIHFDAYAARTDRPVLNGTVKVLSADVLTDQRSGQSYYTMKLSVAPDETKRLGDLKLQPGMQATVMVKTGEHSLMSYLLRPLLRRFATALSE